MAVVFPVPFGMAVAPRLSRTTRRADTVRRVGTPCPDMCSVRGSGSGSPNCTFPGSRHCSRRRHRTCRCPIGRRIPWGIGGCKRRSSARRSGDCGSWATAGRQGWGSTSAARHTRAHRCTNIRTATPGRHPGSDRTTDRSHRARTDPWPRRTACSAPWRHRTWRLPTTRFQGRTVCWSSSRIVPRRARTRGPRSRPPCRRTSSRRSSWRGTLPHSRCRLAHRVAAHSC